MRVLFGDEEECREEDGGKKIRCLWFIISYNRSLYDPTVSILKKDQTIKNMLFNKVYGGPPIGYVWIGGEWWNGMEWNGMEWSGKEPHSIVWICKKGMEWNGV